jgi:hypothetical protein
MKKLYLTLLVISLLAFVGLTGFALLKSEFEFVKVLQPFLSLLNAPIQFALPVIDAGNFTDVEVLGLGGLIAIAFIGGLVSLIFKISKRRLMAGLTSLVLTVLSAYLIVAMIVPYFSVLNDGVGIGRYAFYIGDIISSGSFDADLFYTILDNGSLVPLLALDILLLLTLNALFSKGKTSKVVTKVKVKKVPDSKKVVVADVGNKVSPTQPAPVGPVTPAPSTLTTDTTLSELVRLVMAEEVQALKNSPTYGSTNTQVDAALIRRIVAEELSRFQVHFISRAEVQTILAQEIALLKLSLNIK